MSIALITNIRRIPWILFLILAAVVLLKHSASISYSACGSSLDAPQQEIQDLQTAATKGSSEEQHLSVAKSK
jgi:hypothetical protein